MGYSSSLVCRILSINSSRLNFRGVYRFIVSPTWGFESWQGYDAYLEESRPADVSWIWESLNLPLNKIYKNLICRVSYPSDKGTFINSIFNIQTHLCCNCIRKSSLMTKYTHEKSCINRQFQNAAGGLQKLWRQSSSQNRWWSWPPDLTSEVFLPAHESRNIRGHLAVNMKAAS